MKQTGWRKPTPGLGVAEQHAQAGEHMDIAKTRAFVAVKRVGAHIGLKAGDLLLLDTLGAFTKPQDWAAGQRPIVWASNAYLMAQTGFSLSALKRHARRLAEHGVIAFRDSSNGKRWGRRDDAGVIVEAYGFDLSPLAARTQEFEAEAQRLEAERNLCLHLKRQITIARRMIRARLQAAIEAAMRGPWAQLGAAFETLLAQLPGRRALSEGLERLLASFQRLQSQVEAAFVKGANVALTKGVSESNDKILDPSEVISEPHIPTTNQLHLVNSNCSEKEPAANVPPEPSKDDTEVEVDIATVMKACPEFATWAHDLGGYLRNWADVYRMAGQLRPMIGISEQAWHEAQAGLGRQAAAAALVLVFDKHATGEISSPGGYLRGMVQKAGAGDLHLERSLYGRLRRTAA